MSETTTYLGKSAAFIPDWRRDGYHCADCAANAGYGTFHYDTIDAARKKHQEKYGWSDRVKG